MIHLVLEQRLQQALRAVLPSADIAGVKVRPCPEPRFGDYQANAMMTLAKERRVNPRQLAADVLGKLDVAEWCETVEVAGAGFLNFRLRTSAVADSLRAASLGRHLFFEPVSKPRTIVVDFSSPNVAKPMHVGHIRSTILGDCLARVLRLLGHRVITDNHVGDWGTQFGKLIWGWKRRLDPAALARDPTGEMEQIYKASNAACDADPALYEEARQELAKLQAGDGENRRIWQQMIELSQVQFQTIYRRLGVQFEQTLGESFYNPQLPRVVQELQAAGVARESEGAMKLFFADVPELKEHPAVIRKNDGAATYTTTDLATLEYRLATWRPDEIIYVTDGRQQLHFKEVFTAFQRWHPDARIKLAHVWFGSILGEDGKPFKTRTGDTVKLADLLDEAEERAYRVVTEKNPELTEPERREVARVVGLGAVKYADLLPNRQSDYVFNWDKMLALTGNTAPYLLYAYTRTRSIFRKLEADRQPGFALAADGPFPLTAPEEMTLGKHLLNFGLVLEAVAAEYRPNYLCNFLYDLAGHFARFYEACPVLKATGWDRSARLALCDLTGHVLKQGLTVLGLETAEKM